MNKTIYITEKQKKHIKKAIAAQDQVGGKVNAGVMDAVVGGMCENYTFKNNFDTYYRGYNSKYKNLGVKKNQGIWLTDNIEYAKIYAKQYDEFGKIAEIIVDNSKLNPLNESDLYDMGMDPYYSSETTCKIVKDNGYNCWFCDYYDYNANGLCLIDKTPIVKIRILSNEEYDSVPLIAENVEDDKYKLAPEKNEMSPYYHVNEEHDEQENMFDVNNIIYTDVFKGWFGDWENNPQNSSKIVDKNGFPIVVHHGSPEFFGDSFDKKYIGHSMNFGEQGIFCTTQDIAWARRFSLPVHFGNSSFTVRPDYSRKGTILSGFLNVRHPLDLFNITEQDLNNMFEMHIKYDEFGKHYLKEYGRDEYYKKFIAETKKLLQVPNHQLVKFHIHTNFGNALKEFGYDGFIASMDGMGGPKGGIEYCFLEPNQFKSIKSLAFNPSSDSMYENKNKMKNIINESPDSIWGLKLNFKDSEAVTFMYYLKTNKFYVADKQTTHIEMIKELGLSDEECNEIDEDNFFKYVDLERTGRYWPSVNVISFWKTPVYNKSKMMDAIASFSVKSNIDIKYLLIDYWDGPVDRLIPFRWFTNGTFDMLKEIGFLQIYPNDSSEYIDNKKYTTFTVLFPNGEKYELDIAGNFVENKYQYTYAFNEGKRNKKIIKNDKGEIVPETCDKCGGKVVVQIHGEPVYVCKDCGKYFGTMPFTLDESKLNESFTDCEEFYEDHTEFDLLSEFMHDKENNIKQKKWNLIPAEQYHTLLKRYMNDPIMARIPYSVVHNWFTNIIVPNALDIYYITNLAGHSSYFPSDVVSDYFDADNIVDYKTGSEYLDSIGFYDWCKLPDGTDAWSDYGLNPLFQNIHEYTPNMSAEDLLILINRCLDVAHQRGDLSSAFVQGGKKSCDYISNGIRENIENEITSDDVDLSSFNIKKQLNPKFWQDGHLDSRIRLKLLDIADDFIDFLDVDWVKPKDVIMTGSLANFNWNGEYSDIDLHILMDFSDVDENVNLVKNYFLSKKSLWNDEHKDIKIFGFPVELYVQDINEEHDSSGVYSLDRDVWLVEPDRDVLATSKVNKQFIKNKVSEYVNQIDKLIYLYKKNKNDEYKLEKISKKANKLWDEIKDSRKKGFEISGGKEVNNFNIIFKSLKRNGYLDKLYRLKTKTYDNIMSVE